MPYSIRSVHPWPMMSASVYRVTQMRKICSMLAGLVFASSVHAQSCSSAQSSARFALSSSTENPRCWIAVNSSSSYQYVFRAPLNWIPSQDLSQKRIRFQDSAKGSVLTVRFADEPAGIFTKVGRCQWLQELILKFPKARLQQKSEMAALSYKAVILDLAWKSTGEGSGQRVGRFARVPLASGTVELSLLASSEEDFESSLPAFTALLNSLQGSSKESDSQPSELTIQTVSAPLSPPVGRS